MLFTGRVKSACGLADAAVGPFYCPGDQKVYIDLEFYDELKNRFHAGGDFANAYVIAHEVGHHVQNLMGISIESKHRKLPRESENQLSVRLELQADFLAGVWAHYADQKWHILEAGRRREGDHRRPGHRRRQAAEAGPRLRRAGEVHARHVQAAGLLVQRGPEERQSQGGR